MSGIVSVFLYFDLLTRQKNNLFPIGLSNNNSNNNRHILSTKYSQAIYEHMFTESPPSFPILSFPTLSVSLQQHIFPPSRETVTAVYHFLL